MRKLIVLIGLVLSLLLVSCNEFNEKSIEYTHIYQDNKVLYCDDYHNFVGVSKKYLSNIEGLDEYDEEYFKKYDLIILFLIGEEESYDFYEREIIGNTFNIYYTAENVDNTVKHIKIIEVNKLDKYNVIKVGIVKKSNQENEFDYYDLK